ncbi:MAG TPA: acetate--CoA ligase family protein [bacterium]|nr:acetate--CoA ligase family protein [bacterium]
MQEVEDKSNEIAVGNIIKKALDSGRTALSESEAAKVFSEYGVPVVEGVLCENPDSAAEASKKTGFPIVLKLCSPDVAHKKEKGFVQLGLTEPEAVREKSIEMLAKADGLSVEGLLVQRMMNGERELLAGMRRDPVFGTCVTLGLGGIFTEALNDIAVRVAPVERSDMEQMIEDLSSKSFFGQYRGLPEIDMEKLLGVLKGLGDLGLEHAEIKEIDANPLVIDEHGRPVAVDALVILENGGGA